MDENIKESVQNTEAVAEQKSVEPSKREFECNKCKKALPDAITACECGGYPVSKVKAGETIKINKEIGVFGWIASLVFCLPTLIISFLVCVANKSVKARELMMTSGLCTGVYLFMFILYKLLVLSKVYF